MLDKYRKEIDDIDKELVVLMEKRLEVVSKIARYKEESSIEITDNNREGIVIDNAMNSTKNKSLSKYIGLFIKSVIDVSKEMQRDNR